MKRHITTAKTLGALCLGALLLAGLIAAGGDQGRGPTMKGWSHLYVRALDTEKTFNFYHRVLGMEFVGSKTYAERDQSNPKVYYYFQAGKVRICVGGWPATPSDYRPGRMSRLSLHWEVHHVGEIYDRLRNMGYTDMTEPRTSRWGARTFTAYDPNGIAIAFTEWTGKSDWQQRNLLDHTVPFSG